jgi:hypothetical protein
VCKMLPEVLQRCRVLIGDLAFHLLLESSFPVYDKLFHCVIGGVMLERYSLV